MATESQMLHFVTGNVNKLRELRAILPPTINITSTSIDRIMSLLRKTAYPSV